MSRGSGGSTRRQERLAILKTADEVGPVEAARHHGVPQTTVSNWLHRDATKVAREVGERADESKPTRTRRAATSAISKAPVGSTAMPPPPTFTLILIDDCARFVTGHGVDDAERADLVIQTFEEAVARHHRIASAVLPWTGGSKR